MEGTSLKRKSNRTFDSKEARLDCLDRLPPAFERLTFAHDAILPKGAEVSVTSSYHPTYCMPMIDKSSAGTPFQGIVADDVWSPQ